MKIMALAASSTARMFSAKMPIDIPRRLVYNFQIQIILSK